jgi:hypothetical protein
VFSEFIPRQKDYPGEKLQREPTTVTLNRKIRYEAERNVLNIP